VLEDLEIPKVNAHLFEKRDLVKDKLDFAERLEIVLVDLLRVNIFKSRTPIIPSRAPLQEQ
jgi:hypothetical protein